MGWNEFIGITTLLYALANPLEVIPIFLGFTKLQEDVKAKRIIIIASIAVAAFLIISGLFGKQILSFFNVGLDDFRIAGGLLALFVAFEMFQARFSSLIQTSEEKAEAEADIHGIAITPLAFPLLIGPAEMSVMITFANDMQDWRDKILLVLTSLITASLIAVSLFMAEPINRFMGKTGMNVVTRVMALFVAAIGIKFIMTGIRNELPGLAG